MSPFQLNEWTVVPDRNELVSAADTRKLEPKAMELLVRLAAIPNVVVSKDELLRDVWNDAHVVEHVLPKTLSSLRKALGDDAQTARFIQTVPRRGYVLIAEPRAIPAAPQVDASRVARAWSRGTPLAIAASLIVLVAAAVFSVHSDPRTTLALLPTRAANATVANDAGDALAHDLTKFSCLAVTRQTGGAQFRLESNVVDVAGKTTLRTRLVQGGTYVAAIDTPAGAGVVNASRQASAKLVKH
ncbi:MAG TPA: winged helix-turn-helix domain-containing protein, partial [Thermoanaerobaculia bacterium]|nr:winged helix-turn-helix domain-containing protein [Thermoanaerobaculia bacterium]